MGLSNAKRYAVFMRHTYDKNEAVVGKGYTIFGDSFDPNISSSFNVDQYRAQREEADYWSNMPSKPAHYMFDKDTSSKSGNGFKNLAND